MPINQAKLGIYGKSQGGEAALSAMELAPTYAPELDIGGGVALAPGLTPAPQGVLDAVASNPTSTSQNMFVLLIAKSFAANYPQYTSLDAIPSDQGKAKLAVLDPAPAAATFAQQVVDVPLSKLLKQPVDLGLVTALGEAMPGSVPLESPVMVVQGFEGQDDPAAVHPCRADVAVRARRHGLLRALPLRRPSIAELPGAAPPAVGHRLDERPLGGEPAPDNCANQLLGTAKLASGWDSEPRVPA